MIKFSFNSADKIAQIFQVKFATYSGNNNNAIRGCKIAK